MQFTLKKREETIPSNGKTPTVKFIWYDLEVEVTTLNTVPAQHSAKFYPAFHNLKDCQFVIPQH
jgi:hypothetical protein